MARPRIISDTTVFATIRALLAEGGEKAVGFGPVSRATGLAAPTLVQRYGSQRAMVEAALLAAWDDIDKVLDTALLQAPLNAKGAAALIKHLDATTIPATPSETLRSRATVWRRRVEAALTQRLGSAEAGAILFAAWQGRQGWAGMGGKGFTLKDLVRKIT